MARLDWSRLHSKILRSSVWGEEPLVRLVWICALADSETNGRFYGSTDVLARAWNLDEEVVKHGLDKLCQPDPKSTTKEYEGRRIIRESENEWRVLNKRLYNPSGEPVGASTPRVQDFRKRQKGETDETRNESNGRNALEEIRLEQSEKRSKTPRISSKGGPPEDFVQFWEGYPLKVGKGKCLELWAKLTPEERAAALKAVGPFSKEWLDVAEDQKRYCPHPATWLNQSRWEDHPDDFYAKKSRPESSGFVRNNPAEDEDLENARIQDLIEKAEKEKAGNP